MATTTESLILSAVNAASARLTEYRLTKEEIDNKTNRWYWKQQSNIIFQRMTIQKVCNIIARTWTPDGTPGSDAYAASLNALQRIADSALSKEITRHRAAEEAEAAAAAASSGN